MPPLRVGDCGRAGVTPQDHQQKQPFILTSWNRVVGKKRIEPRLSFAILC